MHIHVHVNSFSLFITRPSNPDPIHNQNVLYQLIERVET